eukprot:4181198-Pyramimonas_sp.AAC.1
MLAGISIHWSPCGGMGRAAVSIVSSCSRSAGAPPYLTISMASPDPEDRSLPAPVAACVGPRWRYSACTTGAWVGHR